MKKTLLTVLSIAVVATAMGYTQVNKVSASQDTEKVAVEKRVKFHNDYAQIVEDELTKHFPKKVQTGEDTYENILDTDKLDEFGTYYIDYKDAENLKYVFLMDKEDSKEVKEIKKDLEDQLGSKVQFKNSKVSKVELKKAQREIADKLLAKGDRYFGVEVDAWTEQVVVRSNASDQLKSEIQTQYGDMVRFEQAAVKQKEVSYSHGFKFGNIGGGHTMFTQAANGTIPNLTYINEGDKRVGLQSSTAFIAIKNNQAYMVTAGHSLTSPSTTNPTRKSYNGTEDLNLNYNSDAGEYQELGWNHWSGDNATDKLDAGLIKLTNTNLAVTNRAFYTGVNGLDRVLGGYVAPVLGDIATKSGAATGTKSGTIKNLDAFENFGSTWNVEVARMENTSQMSAAGDSGGVVYDSMFKTLGIHVAGGYTGVNQFQSWFTRADIMMPRVGMWKYDYNYDTSVASYQG